MIFSGVMAKPEMLTAEQYRSIVSFRHQLRRFLAFSEAAAAEVGLPAQQHQHCWRSRLKQGWSPPPVGTLAEQLIMASRPAAELVEADLVTKKAAQADRRRQELTLTEKAASMLATLTATHQEELVKLHNMAALAS